MIRIENLSKSFTLHNQGGAMIPVMGGANLSVAPGECVGLTGQSGAGKSTLLNLLTRFYETDRGRILLDGVPVAALALPAVAANEISTDITVDHQVAHSVYMFDPDGNYNEFYCDTVRDWRKVLHGAMDLITSHWDPLSAEGFTDGLSQFDSAFNVSFLNQNGSEVGQLNGVTIDDEGFVIASFNNGETRRLYKLPIATFADPTELQARDGFDLAAEAPARALAPRSPPTRRRPTRKAWRPRRS